MCVLHACDGHVGTSMGVHGACVVCTCVCSVYVCVCSVRVCVSLSGLHRCVEDAQYSMSSACVASGFHSHAGH